jgi:hypothetical protein
MRSIKMYMSFALVALMAMAGAVGASASTWDPQGTVVHGHGTLRLITNTGAFVHCTVTLNTKASGDLATTTDAAGNPAPPTFSACSNSISNLATTTVTGTIPWTATAASTTAVTVTGGADIKIELFGATICTITAHALVSSNPWSNTAHTLTANSSQSFPIAESGSCDGGTTGSMSGDVTFPSSAVIT